MIERKIIIGLITNIDYLNKITPVLDLNYFESKTAKMLASWAIKYYQQYSEPIGPNFETHFYTKLSEGLDNEISEEIEEEILPDLSDEFINTEPASTYLLSESIEYFQKRKLTILSEQIDNTLNNKNTNISQRVKDAEDLAISYNKIELESDSSIDLAEADAVKRVKQAFLHISDPLIIFPKQLGKFWNNQFVRGGFVSLLAPEKRGKTFWLLELAIRAASQGRKVAFFQAGDMNEAEQLKRISVYLNKRSNLEKYCEAHYSPVRDCVMNQLNTCQRPERECDYGPFSDKNEKELKEITIDELSEMADSCSDYIPCHNCSQYDSHKLGAVWLEYNKKVEPIDEIDAVKAIKKFFVKHKRHFKLSTHANGTLSVKDIESKIKKWQKVNSFVPDIIIIDYADLLVPPARIEFRHGQNEIWKQLRKLSQTPINGQLPLVIAPTQADAQSYKSHRLELSNFSEDKRKFAHCTAMYGLNQSPDGREKKLGIMRINEIIIREGEFSNDSEVVVLQDLRRGRPFTQSFFQK